MIVDFFRHGTGLSKNCLDYLLGEDREREHAQVLSGDVQLTAQLIDSSPFTKKYTSGCLSFYEHDLDDQDKQKIMQDFERCLFPGLEQDQYKILWVEHRDKFNQDKVDLNKLPTDAKELDQKRRLELNFVIPNVELSTGKRLQPFYASVDLDRVDLFKKITNTKYVLYDPDAPEHRQLLLDKKHLPNNVKDFKSQLHGHIYRAVVDGDITDRQTLVQWLESHQIKVTRQVKQSISIENPFNDAKRPIRLEGEIYEQGFTATGEYRQEVQRRIKTYRATARKRYRTDFRSYQKQLKHKSEYHSERYSGIGQKDRSEPSTELRSDRQQADRAPSLARIEIEPFTAVKRADRERSTESPQQGSREEAEPFKYHADFNGCYFSYLNFIADLDRKRKVQRDRGFEQRDFSPTSQSRSLEQFGWESEHHDMQTRQQPIQTPMYFDQRKTGKIREWLLHSNGILKNDRIRNKAIEDHRRTTATITATTSAIEKATSGFGIDARRYYESLVSAVTSHQERSEQLAAATTIISDNTATISRSTEKYSELYQTDQWQSSRDKPDHSQQRGRIRENIEATIFSIDTIRESTAELARNLRSVESNIIKVRERQKEIEKPRPKDRGIGYGR